MYNRFTPMLRTYLAYYRFLLKYRWLSAAFIVSLIIWSVTQSIQPYFYKLFVDSAVTWEYSVVLKVLASYIAIRFLESLFDVITCFLGDAVVFPASRDARVAVVKKIQELDFAFHLSKSTGSLISAIKRGDAAFFDIHRAININLSRILISFIVIVSVMFRLNWQLALIMFATFALNLLIANFLIRYNIKTRQAFNEVEDEISGYITDNLINFETVKLFAKEKWEVTRLSHKFRRWMVFLWRYANSFRLIDITIGVVGNSGLFLVLLFGLYQLSAFRLTAGEYIMVLGFVSTFYPRFFQLIYELRSIAKNQTDIEKYFSYLSLDPRVKDPPSPLRLSHVQGRLDFADVSFSYPEGKKGALKNISLSIPSGQSIAFIGHSGVGKTTLIKLLMRFYDPDRGTIFIDGCDIRRFTKTRLRSFMGVVPQEPILFNNTIAYNIAYGSKSFLQSQVIKAAKLANLHEFIMSLPQAYQTPVGERGVKLSGGQKQRLAIARMILSDPDIIIFDEATSQLDSESERQIQDAFWKAAAGKTTLIIAHRLSTIIRADRIVVMNRGRIKEIGTHRQLLAQPDSLYSHFWRLQTS